MIRKQKLSLKTTGTVLPQAINQLKVLIRGVMYKHRPLPLVVGEMHQQKVLNLNKTIGTPLQSQKYSRVSGTVPLKLLFKQMNGMPCQIQNHKAVTGMPCQKQNPNKMSGM